MSLWRNLASLIYDLERRLAFKTTDIVDVETENYTKVGSAARGPAYANFAADSYVYFPKLFNPGRTPFEMVFKVTTSGILSGEEEFICSYAGNYTTEIGTDGRYWDWEYRNSVWRGSHQIDYNTTYFVKLEYTGDNYYCYYKKEGDEEWILDLTWNSSQPRDATILQLGSDTNSGSNTQYWKGVVDLKESYVKIGDEYWLDGPNAQARDYVNRGCEEIEPKVFVGGSGYFLAIQKYIYFQNYHDWNIEFKYTHNTNPNTYNAIIGQDYQDYSGLTLNVRNNGDLQINLKNSGNSWLIADTSTGLTLQQDQTYYFKLGYESTENSGNYYLKYKLNEEDEWIDQWDYESSATHYQHDQLNFLGSRYYSSSRYNTGTFYLNTLKITGNGVTLFDGETAEEGDFFVVGTPVAEENRYAYYNFNTGNYLNLGCGFDPGNRPWEWQMKFKTGTDVSTRQYILGSPSSNQALLYCIYNGNLCMYLSSTGSSWNIMDCTPLMSISGMETYWTRFGWDGQYYYLDASLDGETYERKYTLESSLVVKPVTNITMGAAWDFSSNGYFRNGIFYVDESNIKIDGKTYWEYLLYPKQVGDTVTLNEGIGLSKYKWSAFNNITTTFNQFSVDAIIKKIFIDDEGNTVYRLRDIPIQKNKVKLKTGTLYDCYSNGENDVYLKHGEQSVINDYRYTNNGCIQGEDKPFWTNFRNGSKLISNLNKTYTTVNSFEIVWHLKTGSSIGSYERAINWRGAGDYGDSSQGPYIEIKNGWLGLVFKNNNYISIGAASATPNTEYWVKWIYDGTDWYGYNSQDGEEWTLYTSGTPSYMPYFSRTDFDIGIRENGSDSGTIFKGIEYLNDCYIKINDEMAWDGRVLPNPYENNVYSINGSLTNNDSVFSGFSGSNYINLGSTTKNFKAVIHVTATDTGNRSIIDCNAGSWWIGQHSGYLGGWFNGAAYNTSAPWVANKTYWFGVDRNNSNMILYLLEDDGTYTLNTLPPFEEWTYNYSHSFEVSEVTLRLGFNSGSSSEYWRGSIDLNNTIIKDYDNNYIFNPSNCKFKNYSISGSPTYLDSPKQFKGGENQTITVASTIDTNTANSWAIVGKYMFFGFRDGGFISNKGDTYNFPELGCFSNGRLRMSVSVDGTSWLFDNVASSLLLQTYRWYYIKFYFTGTEYKVDVSETGEFNGEEINYITKESTEKAYSIPTSLLNVNGWSSSWYVNQCCDISEFYIEINGVKYKVGEANIISQFYEKESDRSVSPIEINDAIVNNDNQIIYNEDIYYPDISKDVITPLKYDDIYFDSTDGNFDVNFKFNTDIENITTEAPLTQSLKKIDKTKYFTFNLEYLEGYNTFLTISGKPYEPYELPTYFTKDMNITLTLQKIWEPFEVYTKSFWLSQDWIYKKQKVYLDINIPVDKITIYVNGSCKWEYFNQSNVSIELYKEDNIHYIIEKEGYKTIEGDYRVTDNLYTTPSKLINIEMIKVYKCTLIYTPNDADIELVSSNTYVQKDNWIQVYEDASVQYKISKPGYLTQEDYVKDNGEIVRFNDDMTVQINLEEVQENNISGILDTRNVKNYNCRLYRDSRDHLIASGERNNTTFSNYTYIEGPIFPVREAKSWEYRTAYRYKSGGTYALIAGSSKTSWKQGAFNFYTRDNKFRLDFPINDEYYYISDQNLNITPESGYEYKFKIGQILEHNNWIDYEPIVNPLYQKTDYLEINSNTSASNFYISTGLFGSETPSENYSIEAKVRFYSVYENAIIINDWAANSYFLMTYRNTCRWHGDSNGFKDFGSISTNTDYTIKVDVQNNLLYINDTSYSYTPGTCGTNEIKLFGGYSASSGNAFYGRIYNIKFKDSNGNVVRDYIPAMEKSTGTFGLYEKINDEFKVNEGTGTFTSGSNTIDAEGEGETSTIYVDYKKSDRNTTENPLLISNDPDAGSGELPSNYQKAYFIESHGLQYIDTGIYPNPTYLKIEGVAEYSQLSDSGAIFGSKPDSTHESISLRGNPVSLIVGYMDYCPYSTYNIKAGDLISFSVETIGTNTCNYTINTYSATANVSLANYVSGYSMKIFARDDHGPINCFGYVKLYSMKIYSDTNTVVRDFVPVYNLDTNKYGLYDKITGNFFGNSGTGEITGEIYSGYKCESSDNNEEAWNAFNNNSNSWINDTQVPSGLDPIWIKYYTPTPVKPTSFTIINDDTYNNMKNGYIEGSIDDETWETIYTIENRGQQKNLIKKYLIDTDKKYNYFKLNITERYNDYKETEREYFTENNSQLDIILNSNFFNQSLYDNNDNGIAEFTNNGTWLLNNKDIRISNYITFNNMVNVNGSLTSNNWIFSGFTTNNYLYIPNFNPGTNTFEIVLKVNPITFNDSTRFMCSNANGIRGFVMGCNPRIRLWMTTNGSSWNLTSSMNGVTSLVAGTDYWIKYNYDGTTYRVYLSTTGEFAGEETLEIEKAGGPLYYTGSPFKFGVHESASNFYLDLKETYIKIDNNYWFDNSILNTIESSNIKVYYSTKVNTLPVTSTNIRQFIIDGFPFTYSNDYIRIYTNIRDAKEFIVKNGQILENPNYVSNKNPNSKVPMSMLNSTLDQSTHYALGYIDLTETKLYVNNQLYWEADHTPEVGEQVYIVRGEGTQNEYEEYTINNVYNEFNGDLATPAEVVEYHDGYTIVKPLEYVEGDVIITSDQEDADIYTSHELPVKNLTINVVDNNGNDIDDAVLLLETGANTSRYIKQSDKYRKIYIEQIKNQTIEFIINNKRFVLNNDNRVLDLDERINNFVYNYKNYYSYIISEDGLILEQNFNTFMEDKNIIWLAHVFKVNITNETGVTITYTIGDKSYVTTDGQIECYSKQVINYKIEKAGFETLEGTYTIPLECSTNGVYTVNYTLDPLVTLTVNSSENDSIITIESLGYEQNNNTISTKQGSVVLEGKNIKELNFAIIGTLTIEEI